MPTPAVVLAPLVMLRVSVPMLEKNAHRFRRAIPEVRELGGRHRRWECPRFPSPSVANRHSRSRRRSIRSIGLSGSVLKTVTKLVKGPGFSGLQCIDRATEDRPASVIPVNKWSVVSVTQKSAVSPTAMLLIVNDPEPLL